ncbi:MAG TPA: hypothetical protein VM914_03830, partial [Pyrinomonadaceae bacterium]|nr:hypothetical protein [Pyrinomonadaceae bacterium]
MSICELERPAFADSYAVAGRSICVEAGDESAAEAFRSYFDGWHVERLPRARDTSARILLHTGGEPPRA